MNWLWEEYCNTVELIYILSLFKTIPNYKAKAKPASASNFVTTRPLTMQVRIQRGPGTPPLFFFLQLPPSPFLQKSLIHTCHGILKINKNQMYL